MRKTLLKQATLTEPYIYLSMLGAFGYLGLTFFANEIYITYETLLTGNPWITVPFVILQLTIAGLTGLNLSLLVLKLRELKTLSRAGGTSLLGTAIALLGGACPGCIAGIFPAVAGLFGVTTSLSVLPLYGLELLTLSVVLLLIGVWYLSRPVSCQVTDSAAKPRR